MTINFIGVVVPLSILLPFFIAVFRWRYLTSSAKYIFLYLLTAALISFAAIVVGKVLHRNNMLLVHILTAAEVVIFLFYYKTLFAHKAKLKLYLLTAAAFTGFCIINAIFFQSIYTYSSYTRSIEAIICMLLALNYFARLASDTGPEERITRRPDFYFNAGIFLYFSGAFMLFIFSNFIITSISKTNFYIIWNIHGVLLVLMYLLFSIGFILCRK